MSPRKEIVTAGGGYAVVVGDEHVVLVTLSQGVITLSQHSAKQLAKAILKVAGLDEPVDGFGAGDMADARAEGFRQGQAAEWTKYVELFAAVVSQNAAYDEMVSATQSNDATWDAAYSRFERARERVTVALAGARA